ncbi:uncharacterized protein LOC113403103 [Vanessa tameamea]|uniref:Uncharacterized protein LOC113403103 n=1 Tax=Vanessa tameamea TaxID=334116 RepID=A0A8B8IQB6_VANTA
MDEQYEYENEYENKNICQSNFLSENEMVADIIEVESKLLEVSHEVSKDNEEQKASKRDREEDEEDEWKLVQKKNEKKYKSRSEKEYFEIYISSREKLPKQFALAKIFCNEGIINIEKIKYINPFKIRVDVDNEVMVHKIEQCKKFIDLGWRIQRAMEVNLSYGVIKNVDIELSEEEIVKSIICPNPGELISVSRLLRRNREGDDWKPSESIRLCFKGSYRPSYICVDGLRIQVEPYVFPVSQCSRCWKLGHTSKRCSNTNVVCPKCGDNHPNCDTTMFKCSNCGGQHMSLLRSCPAYRKEKRLRELMAEFNCTYRKALTLYVPTESHKLENYKSNVNSDNKQTSNMFDILPQEPSPILFREVPTYADIVKETSTTPQSKRLKKTMYHSLGKHNRFEEDLPVEFDDNLNSNTDKKYEKKREVKFNS